MLWTAEIVGSTRTRGGPRRGIQLLLLRFRAQEDDASEPEREAWTAADSLSDLSELQLIDLLGTAKSVSE